MSVYIEAYPFLELQVTDFELIPGGRDIRVTEENKHEYVDKVAEHRLTTAIRPQINAFMDGFNELVSRELISIFNDKELELLISGLPEIDRKSLPVLFCEFIKTFTDGMEQESSVLSPSLLVFGC